MWPFTRKKKHESFYDAMTPEEQFKFDRLIAQATEVLTKITETAPAIYDKEQLTSSEREKLTDEIAVLRSLISLKDGVLHQLPSLSHKGTESDEELMKIHHSHVGCCMKALLDVIGESLGQRP